jgi:hypothetical protein
MACGQKNHKHRKGCADYRKMLEAMFGRDARAIFAASDNGLLPPPPWLNTNKAHSRRGPHKVSLTPQEINKINLLYHLNGWNITNISKTIKRSTPVIERNLFGSKAEWEKWNEKMIAKGEL